MRWFKHHTNAHKGKAISALREHGFDKAKAYGLYFLFTAFLADMWEDGDASTFKISASELSSFLGLKRNKLSSFLECLQNESRIDWSQNGNILQIEFPKLLEIKHKDGTLSRKKPEKNPLEKKRKEKNIYPSEFLEEFKRLSEEYVAACPDTVVGQQAEKRFREQFKTAEEIQLLSISLAHYLAMLEENKWRKPKTSFQTFLGTKSSGYFWRNYINKPSGQSSLTGGYGDGL